MSPEQVIAHYGTQAAVCRALGIKQPSVFEWVANGRIPRLRQYQIQLETRGKLLADDRATPNGAALGRKTANARGSR
jgi:hypothetical protein